LGLELLTEEEKQRILRTLERDSEFRLAIAGLLGLREILEELRLAVAGLLGLDEVLRELKKLREDFNRFIIEQEKRWEENNRRWDENAKRWEEADRKFKAIVEELKSLKEELKSLREDHNKLREDFNNFVMENAKRWEEADRKFKWLMNALAEIRDSLGGAFEYYTANAVKALLSERGITCDVRVNVVLPIDGFKELDVFSHDPLIVGEATTSLRTIEEAERELAKLLSNTEAAERLTGRKAYLKILAVESAPINIVEHLRKRAKELDVYLMTGREY